MLLGFVRINFSLIFLLFIHSYASAMTIPIAPQELHAIADKIWHNECNHSYEGLTSWNQREDFASLGIGHFIWYPANKKKVFCESFPSLLAYMQKKGTVIPAWLLESKACPWASREEFLKEFKDPRMVELRQFLYDTRDEQALFMAERLQNSLPKIINKLPAKEQQHVLSQFKRVLSTPMGLYALLDYVNFKGEGVAPEETYDGKGWGLLQVLQGMPSNSSGDHPLKEFVASAKKTLEHRVKSAPRNREEWKWLRGWYNRLDTYLQVHE